MFICRVISHSISKAILLIIEQLLSTEIKKEIKVKQDYYTFWIKYEQFLYLTSTPAVHSPLLKQMQVH